MRNLSIYDNRVLVLSPFNKLIVLLLSDVVNKALDSLIADTNTYIIKDTYDTTLNAASI